MNSYLSKLAAKIQQGKRLWVGLDPVSGKLPPGVDVVDFCKGIVHATAELAAVYKPNVAFFEALGDRGKEMLRTVIIEIRLVDETMPVLVDAKRGDIGETNKAYAESLFNQIGADAITLHHYLGWEDGLDIFLGNPDWFGYILCRTSNKGAPDVQDIPCFLTGSQMIPGIDQKVPGQIVPLYQVIADKAVRQWNVNGNCGLVVGATYPEELELVRKIAPEMPLLIPGIGKQKGNLEQSVIAGYNPDIPVDLVIGASSAFGEAWKSEQFAADPKDFAKAAGRAAMFYHNKIVDAVNKAKEQRRLRS